MPELPYTAVLFDLDGTIVDSAPGITASLAATFERMNLPVPPPAKLLEWVGPPILDSFRDLAGFDAAESAHALDIYREVYRAGGVFDATPYPGVVDVLRAIRPAGMALSLATSKPESLASAILGRLDVLDAFDELTGASEDEKRSAKADVVEEALRRLRADGADLSRPIMIGDRRHDIEGAAAHDVPTIFVTWGYGSPAEQAGSIGVVDAAAQLRAQLGL
jgi:phosphoglycolate phosphatase